MNEMHQQDSWIKRNGLWFFPVLLFGIGTPVVCCGGLAWVGMQAASLLTAPIEAAVAAIEADPEISAKLGDNIVSGSATSINNMNIDNDNGDVEVGFRVFGSRDSADVKGRMIMESGEWSVDYLTVTFNDGKVMKIPN